VRLDLLTLELLDHLPDGVISYLVIHILFLVFLVLRANNAR
jgi:hypothetical protein